MKKIADENPLEWMIKEYSGHPIYLDVSATWCGPCRAGLRSSESLRKYFKNTDMRFAIIWLRSEKEEWLKVAPTISNALQIFVENAETTNSLTKHLDMIGFPSYFVIDREGVVVKDGVPKYLSNELPSFLEEKLR